MRQDTSDNCFIHFNKALKSLSVSLKNNAYPDTNKVALPIGIGCSGVSDKWLCRYYEIIKKFAHDLSHTGIYCYISVKKQHLYAIDRFVGKRYNHKSQLQLKELKSLAWKDVDEKWFNELISKKEEKLFHNIERNNSVNSTSSTSSNNKNNNNLNVHGC